LNSLRLQLYYTCLIWQLFFLLNHCMLEVHFFMLDYCDVIEKILKYFEKNEIIKMYVIYDNIFIINLFLINVFYSFVIGLKSIFKI